MSLRVNAPMSKFMHKSIKIGARTYPTYANLERCMKLVSGITIVHLTHTTKSALSITGCHSILKRAVAIPNMPYMS